VLFRNWNVEVGPAEWVAKDVWAEIDEHLSLNDIKKAASSLRHYLEYLFGQLAHNFRAPVIYRGDNRYSLGDFLPPVTSRFGKIIKDGIAAAKSWGDDETAAALTEMKDKFNTALQQKNAEIWVVNAQVHYNEWANLDKKDFEPVVKAIKELIAFFQCEKCGGFLYVLPEHGSKELLRCPCNEYNMNLKKK
jgi:hypothetical protein